MRFKLLVLLSFYFSLLLYTSVGVHAANTLSAYPSTPVPLRNLFNNQAASRNGTGGADFDGRGSSFDASQLPGGPSWVFDGVQYDFPTSWGNGTDNVVASGQVVQLEKPVMVHELHMVYSGDASGDASEFVTNFVLGFVDGSTQLVQLYAKNWARWPIINNGAIQTSFHFEQQGGTKNFNSSQIFQWSTAVASESELESITLPNTSSGKRLHLFAMSFTPSAPPPSSSSSAALAVRRVRFTSRWEDVSNDTSGGELERAQVVEVTLVNLLPGRVQSRETSLVGAYEIHVVGGDGDSGLRTVVPGVLHRLVPADQAHVDVLVVGSSNADGRRNATVQVVRKDGGSSEVIAVSEGWETSPLLQEWPADSEVIRTHETPTWWNHAKFGIFVHWGVYSFPAWAPPSQYAEWYNWDLHNPPDASNPTWNHHIETFGKELIYDDFIANFTASKFNASEWIDLFDRAGAKYFVFVTKHHDGFALFDTGNTTHRSSVYFGPKRDFLAELMETAKKEKPDMHRGTYYSLPEWFNPDSARYGFGSWPGGLAHNAFNDTQIEPYTGRLEINDYVEDLQFPHMLDLAMKYETEIMWCDIGGPNKAVEFASQFYTNAMKTGRQVTMNNRCGAVPDFDTPEYATFGAIQPQSWESNEGMDPFSYGLNSATQAVQYKNGTTIVQTLVDIASKNGNFLLDVGPNAEGEIIPAMQQGLLDAGEWLSYSGECVYDTHYWFQSSQDRGAPTGSQPARFLTTPTTFCIVTFDKPQDNMLAIRQRLPILDGDEVALLLPGGEKRNVSWSVDKGTGHLAVQVEQADVDAVKYAWTVQVRYRD